jgi:hypothetical protein
MISKCYLGKSSKDLNNEERLSLINLREAVSFIAKMQLAVATRLQAQYSPFWLRTSSNTQSVLTNVAQGSFANPMRKWTFHLTTLVLRSVWMNQHNSRQDCNLDELVNQLKLTHVLASAQETRDHKKTC